MHATPHSIHELSSLLLVGEDKRSSEDRARADLQCQQLQQQVHTLQTQLQGAQGQVAEAHRVRLETCVAADTALEHACQKLNALESQLQQQISEAEKVFAHPQSHLLCPCTHHWSHSVLGVSGAEMQGQSRLTLCTRHLHLPAACLLLPACCLLA